jgi:hypothetical protein
MNIGLMACCALLAQPLVAQPHASAVRFDAVVRPVPSSANALHPQSGATRAPANRFVGVWILDVTRSTSDSGQRLTSQTRTYEPFGDGQKGTVESVDANGQRIAYGYTAAFDGRSYPMTGSGIPGGADAITISRIDASTIGATLTKAGAEVMRARLTVSNDGNMLTITRSGTINAVLVFNRQHSR